MRCKHGFEYENPRDCKWACYHRPRYLCCYPAGRENGDCDISGDNRKKND